MVRTLFGDQTFLSWVNNNHRLHLFLDSLDECLLRIDTLTALLSEEFRKYPTERLYLRIACRTFEWPPSLEEGLTRLWGKDNFKAFELVPLRRIDVLEAAKTNGLDADAFLHEVDRMEVVPLSIKPVTLDFLLNTFKRKGEFPSTKSALYLDGCRLLCEETSVSRREARLIGNYTPDQRMAVASRIAAVTVFCNRYAISTGVDMGDLPNEDTTIRELCGGHECINGSQFQVNDEAIRETLNTGLFSSRGSNRMGWAHQTYAEFLAARYLVQHNMTLSQMMSLIIHPDDPDGRLVPQLHETAAWLASMDHGVFRETMRGNSDVLIRSDVVMADKKDRVQLVENLLRLFDEERLLGQDLGMHRYYKKLYHSGLAEQIQAYIADDKKSFFARRAAIEIAGECRLKTLVDELMNVALDVSQHQSLREEAIYAVDRIGDEEAIPRLKPIAAGGVGDDPEDQLKGYALQALWPKYIGVEELFDAITPPKRENFIGRYYSFVAFDLADDLKPEDLPRAFIWVEEQVRRHELPYCFRKLMDKIMMKGWECLESSGDLKAYAKAVFSRLKHYDPIFDHNDEQTFLDEWNKNDKKRRLIIEAILPIVSSPEKDSIRLLHSEPPLVTSRDVLWMIGRIQSTEPQESQTAWAELILRAFDWSEANQADAIVLACQTNRVLYHSFKPWLDPIRLDSPEAQRIKDEYLEQQKILTQHRQKRPQLKPSPSERISNLLGKIESGKLDAWWQLNMEMTLKPNSLYYGDEFEADLTTLPGWLNANLETKERIIKAAKEFMLGNDPEADKWLGTNTFYRPAGAGYRGLILLLREAPDFLKQIPSEGWKRWAPIILAYPESSHTDNEKSRDQLMKITYQNAPDEIISTLLTLIDKENKDHKCIFITQRIQSCWDDKLANALLIKAKDENMHPKSLDCLIRDLLDHQAEEAQKFVESLLQSPLPTTEIARQRAMAAAKALMMHAEDAGWAVVWQAIQEDPEFGYEVISEIAHDSKEIAEKIGKTLLESQIADLYIRLVYQYPYAEDPKPKRLSRVSRNESVKRFRDAILNYLRDRGTNQACEALKIISREFPDKKWLKWMLLEAQNITRRLTWVPPNPEVILKFASNQHTRFVQSGIQLLDIVLESLGRLEQKLQGTTPAAIYLWNEINENKKKIYIPKDENRLSDYVKIHLDEDLKKRGIVVNREVEIRRGQKTDIHVDAIKKEFKQEDYDIVKVIIEVKGCWNQDLPEAMQTQLADRYLKDNDCKYGLYLVGWFNCDKWDTTDYRKGKAPKLSFEEAQKQYDIQAADLSQEGLCIKSFVLNTALQ